MSARRQGFTLVELIVVIVLTAVVLGAIYRVLIGQQRTARHQRTAIAAQQDLRTGLAVLTAELRPISPTATAGPADGDLLFAGGQRIKFRAFRDVGIVCEVDVTAADPDHLDIWVVAGSFAPEDSVLIFAGNLPEVGSDGEWIATELEKVDGPAACDGTWAGHDPLDLEVPNALDGSVNLGGLVRSFEVLTYGLFEIEDKWMLARIEDAGTSDVDTVPLIGPLANDTDEGLRIRYFDTAGNLLELPTVDESAVGRIEITLRAKRQGGIDGMYVDTLTTQVYLRNN